MILKYVVKANIQNNFLFIHVTAARLQIFWDFRKILEYNLCYDYVPFFRRWMYFYIVQAEANSFMKDVTIFKNVWVTGWAIVSSSRRCWFEIILINNQSH